MFGNCNTVEVSDKKIIKTRNGWYRTIIVLHGKDSFCFNVFSNFVEWKYARLLWIGFYKNDSNNACFIDSLPKDVINYIVAFLGNNVVNDTDDQTKNKVKCIKI